MPDFGKGGGDGLVFLNLTTAATAHVATAASAKVDAAHNGSLWAWVRA
jgi:hypothetical protein